MVRPLNMDLEERLDNPIGKLRRPATGTHAFDSLGVTAKTATAGMNISLRALDPKTAARRKSPNDHHQDSLTTLYGDSIPCIRLYTMGRPPYHDASGACGL